MYANRHGGWRSRLQCGTAHRVAAAEHRFRPDLELRHRVVVAAAAFAAVLDHRVEVLGRVPYQPPWVTGVRRADVQDLLVRYDIPYRLHNFVVAHIDPEDER